MDLKAWDMRIWDLVRIGRKFLMFFDGMVNGRDRFVGFEVVVGWETMRGLYSCYSCGEGCF